MACSQPDSTCMPAYLFWIGNAYDCTQGEVKLKHMVDSQSWNRMAVRPRQSMWVAQVCARCLADDRSKKREDIVDAVDHALLPYLIAKNDRELAPDNSGKYKRIHRARHVQEITHPGSNVAPHILQHLSTKGEVKNSPPSQDGVPLLTPELEINSAIIQKRDTKLVRRAEPDTGAREGDVKRRKGTETGRTDTHKVRTRWDDGVKAMEGILWGKEPNRGYLHNPSDPTPKLYLAEARWLPYYLSDGTTVVRRGLFTNEPIKRNQIITTYAGPGRYVDRNTVGSHEASYYMTLVKGSSPTSVYVIDGIREPCEGYGYGSFGNDRRGRGTNNSRKIVIDSIGSRGQTKTMGIFIKATEDIPAGAEVTFSYGTDYFGLCDASNKEPWMVEQELLKGGDPAGIKITPGKTEEPSTMINSASGLKDHHSSHAKTAVHKNRTMPKRTKKSQGKVKLGNVTRYAWPDKSASGKYTWKEVHIKQSGVGRGNGLYTRRQCRKGLMIPILGRRITDEDLLLMESNGTASHTWTFTRTNYIKHHLQGAIDGRQLRHDHRSSLFVAMAINEPQEGEEPNCIFKDGVILLCKDLGPEEELTVWYGDGDVPNAQRARAGYTIDHDICQPELGDWSSIPTYASMAKDISKLLDLCPIRTNPTQKANQEGKQTHPIFNTRPTGNKEQEQEALDHARMMTLRESLTKPPSHAWWEDRANARRLMSNTGMRYAWHALTGGHLGAPPRYTTYSEMLQVALLHGGPATTGGIVNNRTTGHAGQHWLLWTYDMRRGLRVFDPYYHTNLSAHIEREAKAKGLKAKVMPMGQQPNMDWWSCGYRVMKWVVTSAIHTPPGGVWMDHVQTPSISREWPELLEKIDDINNYEYREGDHTEGWVVAQTIWKDRPLIDVTGNRTVPCEHMLERTRRVAKRVAREWARRRHGENEGSDSGSDGEVYMDGKQNGGATPQHHAQPSPSAPPLHTSHPHTSTPSHTHTPPHHPSSTHHHTPSLPARAASEIDHGDGDGLGVGHTTPHESRHGAKGPDGVQEHRPKMGVVSTLGKRPRSAIEGEVIDLTTTAPAVKKARAAASAGPDLPLDEARLKRPRDAPDEGAARGTARGAARRRPLQTITAWVNRDPGRPPDMPPEPHEERSGDG